MKVGQEIDAPKYKHEEFEVVLMQLEYVVLLNLLLILDRYLYCLVVELEYPLDQEEQGKKEMKQKYVAVSEETEIQMKDQLLVFSRKSQRPWLENVSK